MNTYILGINFLHSDSSACIFKNGKLFAAAEEERFSRKKHTYLFPKKSILFCLKYANINISNISHVTINSNPSSSLIKKILFTLKNPKRIFLGFESLRNLKKKISIKNYLDSINPNIKFTGTLEYIDHHEAHIASSFYYSKFEESVNISIDGFGDFVSCAWGKSDKKSNTIGGRVYFPHSMGIFYQSITQFLGFKNYGDEYKVMGLSSYGKPNYLKELSRLMFSTKNGYELDLKYFKHHNNKIIYSKENGKITYKNLYSDQLTKLLGDERKPSEKITQIHMDLAKSAQTLYEDTFFNLLNLIYDKYKIKNLTLSGGCSLNSVANGKIKENTEFENIYISPNPGDAGGAVGSVCVYLNNKNKKILPINNYAYLGNSYTNDEISRFIIKKKISSKYFVKKYLDKELYNIVSKLIINSNIVGWFQGRMEWGQRALGNRSILADARNPEIKNIINSKIKRRESFRPFAPSVLEKYAKDWFNITNEIPFMSEVYPVLDRKKNILPGVTHIDGTARLQTVSKENNEKYYLLIDEFFKQTGVPIILNTSFNENEPIVNTPEEAINCFERTEMDALIIENWIISRKNINEN